MFSKALFKQSCKANATMWSIITFAVCFMLACVMLISGNGNIGELKNSIQDTIIIKEIDSQMEKRALFYYDTAIDGLEQFDNMFVNSTTDTLSYLSWILQKPKIEDYNNDMNMYQQVLENWNQLKPENVTQATLLYEDTIVKWQETMPNINNYQDATQYDEALKNWNDNSPLNTAIAVEIAYVDACNQLQEYILTQANLLGYDNNSSQYNEILGSIMYTLNPNGMFDEFYMTYEDHTIDEYDIKTLINHILQNDINDFLKSNERGKYRQERSNNCISIFLAGNMSCEENVDLLVKELKTYGVDKEKYNTFNYTYDSIKHMAKTAILTYQARIDYEISLIDINDYDSSANYYEAINNKKQELATDISASFLNTLPSMVSDALQEVGKADLYTLIVGSIFYKLAGLLLPIIYMIMVSNNLIVNQVDSGSMAYVLSTSTKRKTVVFTQACYLVGSLLIMFLLTTLTGCVCLSIVDESVSLTYGNLVLLNLGAFLVLFALSGLCFYTSCFFDRSKRSMAIGGGLSIFALVAAMLGLFGSPVIPSIIRLNSLNYFNYVTIISLFDVISIIDGTTIFLYKFLVLIILGVIGYILGTIKFIKKDLPL